MMISVYVIKEIDYQCESTRTIGVITEKQLNDDSYLTMMNESYKGYDFFKLRKKDAIKYNNYKGYEITKQMFVLEV